MHHYWFARHPPQIPSRRKSSTFHATAPAIAPCPYVYLLSLAKIGYPALLALASFVASVTVFSHVFWLQEYIVMPLHILEYGSAFAFAAMLLGSLVWVALGHVCSEKVRNIAWVVLWAYVGRAHAVIEIDWMPLVYGL
jgi:hypothetical protein